MEKNLNSLEKAILNIIHKSVEREIVNFTDHLLLLQVKSRENTGVGMYVNFDYSNEPPSLIESPYENSTLATNKIVEINSLSNGLGFCLDIQNGKINFLEEFTYGDELWDGTFSFFNFREI